MKAVLLASALLVGLVVASETSMSTMPLFVWSGHSELQSKPRSADAALASALTSGQPELVMVYMLDEVSTHDMQNAKESFTHLEDALDKAQSSSFVALPVSKVSVDGLLATARVNGVTGADVESSQIQAYLEAHPELTTNSKPDVIVVHFPNTMDTASIDASLGSVDKAVSAATSGKYSSILSTTSSMDPAAATNLAFQFFNSQNLRSSVHYQYNETGLGQWANSPNSIPNALWYGSTGYLTPHLLVSILVMIYMGFLLLTAYCCILSLQTPEKFEGDQKHEMSRALGQEGK